MDDRKRYIVRPRYVGPAEGGGRLGGGSYQVVDAGQVIGTMPTKEEAARLVLECRGRIALTWGKTVIGGKTASRDFAAIWFEDIRAGRVYFDAGTSHSGSTWRWSMYAHIAGRMGNASGREEEKKVAAAHVELEFTRLLARDPDG